jgi:hypothetical protein
MKKFCIIFFLFIMVIGGVFAQRVPVVGILPFEGVGRITPEETSIITRQVIAELNSWGTITVITEAAGADYIVQGTLARHGNDFILTSETTDAATGRKLGEAREQIPALTGVSLFSFCANMVSSVPIPNYLLGTWQSTINMPDGPVVCIIEFRTDRTVRVERYDTWEHKQNNALRYEGYGTGTYSYAGYHTRRAVSINNQQVQADALVSITLNLQETLPEQTTVDQPRLGLVFSGDRNSFEIVGGSLPCGQNFDGPSVYPSASIGFTQFTKIR